MGGIGSGNRLQSGRATVESCRSIDVRRWAREGLLRPGFRGGWQWTRDGEQVASIQMRAESGRILLIYRVRPNGGEWVDLSYPVPLDQTPCRYGGARQWFRCPAQGCARRVAILCLGERIFACRQCYRLAYTSSRENSGDRAARRSDKLRARLGWESGILNGEGGKPKWMRWRTFDRMAARADALANTSMMEMMGKLKLLRSEIEFPL